MTKPEKKLTDQELAARLLESVRYIERDCNGQRYGQFGSPFIDTLPIKEAARRLAAGRKAASA